MQVDLTDQVALVTGAARGIGKSIANRFASSGARVVYTDVDGAGAASAATAVARGQSMALDVTNAAQVEEVVEAVVRHWGRLDIVVNNAGVNTLAHRVTIDQFPEAEWQRILNVDLNGLFLVSRAAAQRMLPRKTGKIINIASVAGLVPLRLQCAFVAAKAGVINLTRAMALELGPHGILVNGIAPGSTLTEGTRQLFYGSDGLFHASVQQMLAHIPLGRPGTTDEIAHAALYLADAECSYVNGHILTVDGGWTAGYTREF